MKPKHRKKRNLLLKKINFFLKETSRQPYLFLYPYFFLVIMIEPDSLLLGDCLDVMKEIPDNSIDLIVTDPPYKVTARGNYGNTGGMMKSKIYMDGDVFSHNHITPEEYAPEFYRILKENTHCYVMCNHLNLQNMMNVFTENGFKFTKSLIWNKKNKIMGLYYMSQFEYILFFRKGEGVPIHHCGTADILEIPQKKHKDADGKNLHDTEKPVELMKILIENSSKEGDTILDPFVGIGTTCLAAYNTNRHYIGIEKDETYFNIAKERIEKAKEQAVFV